MICVSLAAASADEILDNVAKVEFAEIRIDKSGLNAGDVRRVFGSAGKPLVATCRPGGRTEDERRDLLAAAVESGAAYIDLEVENPGRFNDGLIAAAREKHCKVIISYHNYEGTPMRLVMQQAMEEAFDQAADIAKLVCRVKTIQDCSRILSLYELKKNILALGLGDIGVVTRIAAPFLGAPFTYASLAPGRETAEGQPDYETMKSIFELLKRA